LRHLEDALELEIVNRGNEITISGDFNNVETAQDILSTLWEKAKRNQDVTTKEIDAALRFTKGNSDMSDDTAKPKKTVLYDEKSGIKTHKNKLISPRSPNQAKYIEEIRANDMVFGVGPAGTGKTFLAVAAAVHMYQKGEIERMVFCRPAVEAGEKLNDAS